MNVDGSVYSYSEKLCCPIFVGKCTGDVFTGATAHLRVCRRDVHLMLRPELNPKTNRRSFKVQYNKETV